MPVRKRKATREQLQEDVRNGLSPREIMDKYGYGSYFTTETVLSRFGLLRQARENGEKKGQERAKEQNHAYVKPRDEQFKNPIVCWSWGSGKVEGYNRLEEFWAHESYTNIPAPEGEVNEDAA